MRSIKNTIIVAASLIMSAILLMAAMAVNTHNPVNHLLPDYNLMSKNDKRQIECLAENVLFEAGSEPREGQVAVAMVTMNRLNAGGQFGNSVCGVVQQKTKSTCQFSWWCDKKLQSKAVNDKYDDEQYRKVREVATVVYVNYDSMKDPTRGSTFYHATYVSPQWKGLEKTVQIGQHVFYKPKPKYF